MFYAILNIVSTHVETMLNNDQPKSKQYVEALQNVATAVESLKRFY